MKKIIKLLLCGFVSCGLIACGSDSSETTKTEVVKEEKVAEEKKENATIEEQVLVDQNDIKVTAKEYEKDSVWGDSIKILIENNSKNDVVVGLDALIVNDYMTFNFLSSNVAAGKKANDSIYLSSTDLEAAGIDEIGKIEMYFDVFDSNSYETIFKTDCVTLNTSLIDKMDTKNNIKGTELYNENGVKIIGMAVDENSFWGTSILLYCENTTGRNIGISVEDLSVNGFMMTPYFSTQVYNNKKSISEITLMESELEENDIEKIEEVELQFHIYDIDSYDTIADTSAITMTVK